MSKGASKLPSQTVKLSAENQTRVKKWHKTSHGLIFVLTNKLVQACFKDKTELFINSKNKMVTYIDEKS